MYICINTNTHALTWMWLSKIDWHARICKSVNTTHSYTVIRPLGRGLGGATFRTHSLWRAFQNELATHAQ